ncbi:hypothetical protein KUTeg_022469 [Tegillarca granosa]|uniref:Uncharacterized protein n=1 Tax=Tegillarca granosa TaxID=220873 RepID=A0ABQ9E720_TEGGR|nr:hypothetical protein KUTeg_022469 [Tegillarca granosa]
MYPSWIKDDMIFLAVPAFKLTRSVKVRLHQRLQELEPLPEMLKSTELKLHDSHERMMMYERKNSENTKIIAELTAKVEHVTDSLEQMRNKFHDAQDENRLLNSKIDSIERKLRDSEDQNKELLTNLAKREETIHQNNLRLEEKARENASITRQLENALSDMRRQAEQSRDKSSQKIYLIFLSLSEVILRYIYNPINTLAVNCSIHHNTLAVIWSLCHNTLAVNCSIHHNTLAVNCSIHHNTLAVNCSIHHNTLAGNCSIHHNTLAVIWSLCHNTLAVNWSLRHNTLAVNWSIHHNTLAVNCSIHHNTLAGNCSIHHNTLALIWSLCHNTLAVNWSLRHNTLAVNWSLRHNTLAVNWSLLHNTLAERTFQTRITDLESQLSQTRAEIARVKREKEENERKFNSRLYDLKDRLEQSHSTNRSMQNYVQFLKNSYANVFGDSAASYPSTPVGLP